MSGAVATAPRRAYLAGMTASRLLQLLTLVAMLLMPLAMAKQGHAVAATPHHAMAADAGHCTDSTPEQDERGSKSSAECLMACAALPGTEAPLAAERIAPRPSLITPPARTIAGLSPEAETPPPRIA